MVPDCELRGDWRAIIAAVGLALAISGLIVWGLYPKEPNLTGNAGYQEENSRYYPGGSDCYPSNIMRLAGAEGTERAVACQDAREQHRLNANDLIQQRRSADAADAMTVLSYQQAWIATLATVFGFLTLCAAIAAAIYAGMAATAAKLAVRHAESASAAGWEAVKVTRDIGNRQVRAYLGITEIYLKQFTANEPIKISAAIRNTGNSPAFRCTIEHAVLLTDGSPNTLKINFRNPIDKRGDIGGGPPFGVNFLTSPLGQADYDAVICNKKYLVLGLVLRYRDAFGVERRTIARSFTCGSIMEALASDGKHYLAAATRNNASS